MIKKQCLFYGLIFVLGTQGIAQAAQFDDPQPSCLGGVVPNAFKTTLQFLKSCFKKRDAAQAAQPAAPVLQPPASAPEKCGAALVYGTKAVVHDLLYIPRCIASLARRCWKSTPAREVAAEESGKTVGAFLLGIGKGAGIVTPARTERFAKLETQIDQIHQHVSQNPEAVTAAKRLGSEIVGAVNNPPPGEEGGLKGLSNVVADALVSRAAQKTMEKLITPAVATLKEQAKDTVAMVKKETKDLGKAAMEAVLGKSDPNEAKKEGLPLLHKALIGGACLIGGYLITKFVFNQIEEYWNRPRLDFEFKSAPTNDEVETQGYTKMIFSPEVSKSLNAILQSTLAIKQHIHDGDTNMHYGKYALYGPAGSGKRMFVEQLARYARMDFYSIPVSALAKLADDSAVIAVEDFFKNTVAQSSKNGAVVYIDNVGLLGPKLNAFIAQTERRSSLFVLVIAAPFKPQWMMHSGIVVDFEIEIRLPEVEERKRILKMYKDISMSGRTQQPAVEAVSQELTEEKIATIATELAGASASELAEFMKAVKFEAGLPANLKTGPSEFISHLVERSKRKYQGLIQ
jgi:hypothetical protein